MRAHFLLLLKMNKVIFTLFLTLGSLLGCTNNDTLFYSVPTSSSKVDFNNKITTNDSINILDYEYLFNGAGVGIGDMNMDGLPDIFFTGNMVTSRLFLNEGNMKFKDVTKTAGILTDDWCTGVSIVDINLDGRPDIHVATGENVDGTPAANHLFINKTDKGGNPYFEDQAAKMGLAHTGYSVQAAWLDYDKDNDLDLFLINNALETYSKSQPYVQRGDGKGKSTDRLFRNEGIGANGLPMFVDVSQQAGINMEGWSLGVLVSDFNNDGYPDIYVANDFISNDLLYINQKDGTFLNDIKAYVRYQSHNSMGVNAGDLNNDGRLDLMVLDMLPEDNLRQKLMISDVDPYLEEEALRRGYQRQYMRNVLQLRNSSEDFSEIGQFTGVAATDWSWTPLMGDLNNDGQLDLYITNGYRTDITNLDFTNFYSKASVFGTTEEKRKALILELNAMDGVKKSNVFFKNMGNLSFKEDTSASGLNKPSFSNGAAYADFDLDGDLDIVVNNIDEEAFLFENKVNDDGREGANYLRIDFRNKPLAYGARVWVYSNGNQQFSEFYPQRGYLSTMEHYLHFGLGNAKKVDSLRITWPDGRSETQLNLEVNQVIAPKIQNAMVTKKNLSSNGTVPSQLGKLPSSILPYLQKENTFDDFKKWPLRFRSYSKPGPAFAKGDVNGDGLEDLYVGKSSGYYGSLFIQASNGDFQKQMIMDSLYIATEDADATFFDADGDGDLDLYCVSGSSEHYADIKNYRDRLYMNNGEGILSIADDALPQIASAGSNVVPFDLDKDGDLDLFVGGRLDPNRYPFAPRSFLLMNHKGKFTDVTLTFGKELQHIGMVTDAQAIDLDNDGWQDLILAGEWMPITIFYNRQGMLQLDTTANGLSKSQGWWNCIEVIDMDRDGDSDFLVGNWGLNNLFRVSPTQPISLYAKDFDGNGGLEAIFTRYTQGKEHIVVPRNTLMQRLPMLRNRIKDYNEYGTQTFDQIFSSQEKEGMFSLKAYELASSYVENLGDGTFALSPLPNSAQWSPIFDFEKVDIDMDHFPEILAAGNFYGCESVIGRYDATYGLCLDFLENGTWNELDPNLTGFKVKGEVRNLTTIKQSNGDDLILVGRQQDSLQLFRLSKKH